MENSKPNLQPLHFKLEEAHFTKDLDLDERMKGLSIAIADSSKLDIIRGLFLDNATSTVHHDFPEYVYYTDTKKLVKMDTDAAKAEFLGMNNEQFKAWEFSRNLKEDSKLPVLTDKNGEFSISSPVFLQSPPKLAAQQVSHN